jgi:heterotetrameric sarcosine oxidase gamma subunit
VNDVKFEIARMDPRQVSLLQIHTGTAAPTFELAGLLADPSATESAPEGPRVYSLGPKEWLLMGYSADQVRRQLRLDSGRGMMRVTDLSAAFISFCVQGQAARSVLSCDLTAPWAAERSAPGQYACARLGQVDVILHCVGSDSFELHVDRSLADYLESWLSAQYERLRPEEASPPLQ